MIDNNLIYGFLNCENKALLLAKNIESIACDYDELHKQLSSNSRKKYFQELKKNKTVEKSI